MNSNLSNVFSKNMRQLNEARRVRRRSVLKGAKKIAKEDIKRTADFLQRLVADADEDEARPVSMKKLD